MVLVVESKIKVTSSSNFEQKIIFIECLLRIENCVVILLLKCVYQINLTGNKLGLNLIHKHISAEIIKIRAQTS